MPQKMQLIEALKVSSFILRRFPHTLGAIANRFSFYVVLQGVYVVFLKISIVFSYLHQIGVALAECWRQPIPHGYCNQSYLGYG